MKTSQLKQLIKEEILQILSEDKKPSFIKDLTPGKYKIEYKYKYLGDIDLGDITITITKKDIEDDGNISIQNFLNPEVKEGKVIGIRDVKKIG